LKRKVYFFESQIPMGNTFYLPLVSGVLQSYAQTFAVINEHYEFMPFIFMRDTPDRMIKDVDNPFVMAFSVSIWNHQLNLKVAQLVKQRWPQCRIVFGGPQVSTRDQEEYPFIDHIITEEGEKKFVMLLAEFINEKIENDQHNLKNYPSPYTTGLFDKILQDHPECTFQAIVETNRGCPFSCSFCYWGQGFEEKKVRHHSFEHVQAEAEWIGLNKIKYIFMADANFGMYERDQDVARIYAAVKEKYGFPEKIRVCYGKNKEENVFKTALILHKAGLAKAVTLARQSNNKVALDNISRSNIKLSVYDHLRERYFQEGIATYTEIILGMPGETKESFKKAILEIAESPTQLFVYHCTVLPNTEMADPSYIARHGIKTVRVPLTEIHGEIRKNEMVVEYEDIIIETSTMPQEDWIECAVFAWRNQLTNSFSVENVPDSAIERFYQIAEGITKGYSRAQTDEKFGSIYWEPEEMAYLYICYDKGITGDLKEFAKKNVLWGRKSRVHVKKELSKGLEV